MDNIDSEYWKLLYRLYRYQLRFLVLSYLRQRLEILSNLLRIAMVAYCAEPLRPVLVDKENFRTAV